MTRQALLVLGMHRSGTSALARVLIGLGVSGPRTLVPPRGDNPLGFWESAMFHELHERLLRAGESDWDSWTRFSVDGLDSVTAAQFAGEFRALLAHEFGDAPIFVMKDPRICRFVPFWLRNLESVGIAPAAIIIVRSPLEVAASLAVRDGFGKEHALLFWLRHVLDAEFETRRIPRSFVRYADLLRDWKAVACRISADIGMPWPNDPEVAEEQIAGFLTRDLRHHQIGINDLDVARPLTDWVTETCAALDVLLDQNTARTQGALETLDRVRQACDVATPVFERVFCDERNARRRQVSHLESEVEQLREHAAALEGERENLQQYARGVKARLADQMREMEEVTQRFHREVDGLSERLDASQRLVQAVHDSKSWRWTAPLRTVFGLFLRGRPQ